MEALDMINILDYVKRGMTGFVGVQQVDGGIEMLECLLSIHQWIIYDTHVKR